MSINISSFSWNRSFLCSILLPTGAQMACFMWWPLFTIQPHVGPWDATNAAHTGRQPPGHRHLSRQARGARKGHTLKVHGCLCRWHILRSGPAGSWASPGDTQRSRLYPSDGGICVASGCEQGKQHTKCPKLAAELKTSTKPTKKAHHIHLHVHEHLLAEYQCILLSILMDSH